MPAGCSLLASPLDGRETSSAAAQIETEAGIKDLLLSWYRYLDHNTNKANSGDIPPPRSIRLARPDHINFIQESIKGLPSSFAQLDASRGWLIYWTTTSLALLGAPLPVDQRAMGINTLLSFQSPSGGFGGGTGQLAHAAATYSCVGALVTLTSGMPPQELHAIWSRVNRSRMYNWFLKLKLPDGSFRVSVQGEVDVRATYAVLAVASLLNLLTPQLIHSTPTYIKHIQSYEGGMASTVFTGQNTSSITSPSDLPLHPPCLGEAHGGYASCALAAHFMMRALHGVPGASADLDVEALLRWAAYNQGLPIEAGGFKGRTNKLVDGCYSWWCGSMFPILSALVEPPSDSPHDLPSCLFNQEAVQEYTLLVAQKIEEDEYGQGGGLRDKPEAPVDLYHTFYNLAGLSISQHHHHFDHHSSKSSSFKIPSHEQLASDPRLLILAQDESLEDGLNRMKAVHDQQQSWKVIDGRTHIVGGPENEVVPSHPIFNMTHQAVKTTMDYFYFQTPLSASAPIAAV